MKYRSLGKTGMKVSVIGYGAIKLSSVSQSVATATIGRALDLGVNFIDTARSYGDSERKIGTATAGRRDEFFIATKTGERTAEGAKRDLVKSLDELSMDSIDLWQLHTVSDADSYQRVMGPGGAFETVEWAKAEGLIDHAGITIHRDLRVMRDAVNSGAFETIMLAYSIIDQEGVGDEILPLCARKGMGVIVMKPLCGGDLVTPREGNPRGEADLIVRGNLRYVISNPAVTTAIPGIRSVEEVEENCAIGNAVAPLTTQEKQDLLELIGSLGLSFRYGQACLRCGYCQPCPNGVEIPEVFRALDQYQGYPDNLKCIGLETYSSLSVGPDACAECGKCLEKCPAKLDIPARLKEARRILGAALRQSKG